MKSNGFWSFENFIYAVIFFSTFQDLCPSWSILQLFHNPNILHPSPSGCPKPSLQPQTSQFLGATSLCRISCIFSDWTQSKQPSAEDIYIYIYQLVYAACCVNQCLRGNRVPCLLRLLLFIFLICFIFILNRVTFLLSLFQFFPYSATVVTRFCPYVGHKYLLLCFSAACCAFPWTFMIGPYL